MRLPLAVAFAAGVLLTAACHDKVWQPTGPEVWTMTAASSPAADDTAGTVTAPIPRIRLMLNGQPAANRAVTWQPSNGTVGTAETFTDVDGYTSNTWTLGAFVGTQTLLASGPPGSASVTFTVQAH